MEAQKKKVCRKVGVWQGVPMCMGDKKDQNARCVAAFAKDKIHNVFQCYCSEGNNNGLSCYCNTYC